MKRINVAVVGLNFGRHIVRELGAEPASQHFQVTTVCDTDRGKADAIAAQTGTKAAYSLDAVLSDPDIGAVALFTGPDGRAGLLRRIIDAGKDCVTTKPFENDAAEAMRVLCEARRKGRVIHLNSPAPLPPPDLACIAEWRERYALGRPVAAHAETWTSYREKADGSWYDDPQRCPAAPLTRIGIYLVNDLVMILGEPARVQVQTSRIFTGRPTADNAQIAIGFRDGALATVLASFCVRDGDVERNALSLHFEKGSIYRNAGAERSDAASDLSLVMSLENKRQCVERRSVATRSGHYQWEAFYRAVAGEKLEAETTPEQIVAGVQVLEAMARAERNGGEAEIRPVGVEP